MAFRRLLEKAGELPELAAWLAQAAPEQCVPTLWDSNASAPPAPHTLAMYRLLLIQVLTLTRFIYIIKLYLSFFHNRKNPAGAEPERITCFHSIILTPFHVVY